MPQLGALTVTVPGTVGGWVALRERFGRLPLPTLLAPAVRYAEEGFPVSEQTATLWARSTNKLAATPESKATFLIDGRPPRPGELFRNRTADRRPRSSTRSRPKHGRKSLFYRSRKINSSGRIEF